MLKRHYRMTGAVTLFGTVAVGILAGAILALSLLKGNSVRAIINLDENSGKPTFALETAFDDRTVDGVTYLVATVPAEGQRRGRRLSVDAKLGLNVTASQTATVRYDFANMVLHGSTAPTLTVQASTSPVAAAYTAPSAATGGAAGDDHVAFTLDGSMGVTGTGFRHERTLRLRIESVAVKPGATGTITMTVSKTVDGSTRTHEAKTDAVGSANVLRESASPVSPVAVLTTGFRSFATGDFVRDDRLAASVGSLSFGLVDTSYDFFSATSSPVTMRSEVVSDASSVTFAGDFSFVESVYLSEAGDCSSTGSDRASVSGSGDSTRTSTVGDADGKHLCIEVDGATPIRGTQPYRATVAYTSSVSSLLSAFAPGEAELALGRILSGGASVSIPYMSTALAANHRLLMFNRLDENVAYRIEFEPPEGTIATKTGLATGTLPPGSTSLGIRELVTLNGRSRTALTLHVDAPPESLDVLTIRVNARDGSTDTVRYEPEAR